MRYVAFLKAVNVGGHNKVNMKALKHALEQHGFINVSTYIQSGNLLFDETTDMESRIESVLRAEFDVKTCVIIRSLEELAHIVEQVPFPEENTYVTLLSGVTDCILAKTGSEDKIMPAGKDVYIFVKDGQYHKTVYSNAYIEKVTKLSATTRSLKTLRALLDLM